LDTITQNIPESIERRAFITTLVVGFALAAGPARADAIVTDTVGLDAERSTSPLRTGKFRRIAQGRLAALARR